MSNPVSALVDRLLGLPRLPPRSLTRPDYETLTSHLGLLAPGWLYVLPRGLHPRAADGRAL